jgi:type III secretory pathway component EscR
MKKFTKYLKEENEKQNYMFFSNIQEIKRMLDDIEKMDPDKIDQILSEHDWASDHISVATENIEHVYKFLNSIG